MGLINKDNENSFEKAPEQYEEVKVSSKIKNSSLMWQSFIDSFLASQGDDIYSYSQGELIDSKYTSYLDKWRA